MAPGSPSTCRCPPGAGTPCSRRSSSTLSRPSRAPTGPAWWPSPPASTPTARIRWPTASSTSRGTRRWRRVSGSSPPTSPRRCWSVSRAATRWLRWRDRCAPRSRRSPATPCPIQARSRRPARTRNGRTASSRRPDRRLELPGELAPDYGTSWPMRMFVCRRRRRIDPSRVGLVPIEEERCRARASTDDDDLIARVVVLLDLKLEVVPRFQPVGQEGPEALDSVVVLPLGPAAKRRHVQDTVRGKDLLEEIATCEEVL